MKIASSLIEFDSVSSSTSRKLMETKFVSNKNHRILADSAVTLDVEVTMEDFPQYTQASQVYTNLTTEIGDDVSSGVFDTYLQSYAVEYEATNMENSYATSVTSSGYTVSSKSKSSSSSSSSLSDGAIAAIVIVILVVVFGALAYCYYALILSKRPSTVYDTRQERKMQEVVAQGSVQSPVQNPVTLY
jgi:hypothetical protein